MPEPQEPPRRRSEVYWEQQKKGLHRHRRTAEKAHPDLVEAGRADGGDPILGARIAHLVAVFRVAHGGLGPTWREVALQVRPDLAAVDPLVVGVYAHSLITMLVREGWLTHTRRERSLQPGHRHASGEHAHPAGHPTGRTALPSVMFRCEADNAPRQNPSPERRLEPGEPALHRLILDIVEGGDAGCVVTSIRELAARTGRTRRPVQRALQRLEATGRIHTEPVYAESGVPIGTRLHARGPEPKPF